MYLCMDVCGGGGSLNSRVKKIDNNFDLMTWPQSNVFLFLSKFRFSAMFLCQWPFLDFSEKKIRTKIRHF